MPLLGYAPDAEVTKDALYAKITQWLRVIKLTGDNIELCYDYQTDWDLFYDVLDGRVPPWYKRRLVADRINELLRHETIRRIGCPRRIMPSNATSITPISCLWS